MEAGWRVQQKSTKRRPKIPSKEIGFVIFRELMYADLKDSSQSQDKSNMLKYMLLLLHYIKKLT